MTERIGLLADGSVGSPGPGIFQAAVQPGDSLEPGRHLGWLRVLGRRHAVLAPTGASGEILSVAASGPVEYGSSLLGFGAPTARSGAKDSSAPDDATEGWAVRAPIDGIFYRRASPEAEPFVEVGDRIGSGQTLGLVEVMKTFNPVQYGGAGAPDPGQILRIEVGEQQEVAAGDVLLVVGPA